MNADTLYPHEWLINWLFDHMLLGITVFLIIIALLAAYHDITRPETTCSYICKVCCK